MEKKMSRKTKVAIYAGVGIGLFALGWICSDKRAVIKEKGKRAGEKIKNTLMPPKKEIVVDVCHIQCDNNIPQREYNGDKRDNNRNRDRRDNRNNNR